MAEQSLERLDQEITLHLQQIDSNLSYCFGKITQDVIPHVTKYGAVCDKAMDSCNWLKVMFQHAGNLQIDSVTSPQQQQQQQQMPEPAENGSLQTLFPEKSRLSPASSSMLAPPTAAPQPRPIPNLSVPDLNVTTTTTTTTGRVLQLPDSSDDELNDLADRDPTDRSTTVHSRNDPDGSTLQRQRRKRKLSLQLQQQFGSSSSSVVPSPAQLKRRASSTIDSSPMRKDSVSHADSTKQHGVQPGTVIYFPTRDETS
ncbi:LAQU0S01e08438g1_1 [Lachancea quebecensis]|uniref:DASH complex subunit ASK1 n=1 Tax=Lachancea quebecensis TaxID=1654605 RepID=A0A0P1KM47_9SACH|nr:LAQU0S01e08438g1_1 [Lachancea quebecensis]